jgi:DNA repair protein RadC
MLDLAEDGTMHRMRRRPSRWPKHFDTAIEHAKDAANLVPWLKDAPSEVFIVVALNGANHPLRVFASTIGLLDQNQVHPREVYAPVIEERAASIICLHNHPSNTPSASCEDIALTQRLARAGELLGIRFLDHIIVAGDAVVSMKSAGQF